MVTGRSCSSTPRSSPPTVAIDMAGAGIDFLALSGHKLYAPFGSRRAGGRRSPAPRESAAAARAAERSSSSRRTTSSGRTLPSATRPARRTSWESSRWRGLPRPARPRDGHRRRSRTGALGTPLERLARRPGTANGCTLWPDTADRVGVATFNLDGYRHPLLAAILSAEHAIGVRHGCFCAHPLITRLLGIPDGEIDRLEAELRAGRRPALPGAVRASIGLGTTPHDIDRLIDALHEIAATGPRSRYTHLASVDEYQRS